MGAVLRRLRQRAGLSQYELSRRSGLSENHVGVVERGELRSPGLLSVERLSTALEVNPAALAIAFARPLRSEVPFTWTARPPVDDASTIFGSTGLGTALIQLRHSLRLNQGQLARQAGLTRTTVSSLERGGTADPLLHTVVQVADGLVAPQGDLLLLDRVVAHLVMAFDPRSG